MGRRGGGVVHQDVRCQLEADALRMGPAVDVEAGAWRQDPCQEFC